jgi:hypothetical protein
MFYLGLLTGLVVALLVIATLAYFKVPVEKAVIQAERYVSSRGPKPKGFVVLPTTEIEDARQEIIKRNSKLGKSTKLSDLYDKDI